MVDSLMLNPPSHAQYRIEGYYTQPDFFYREHNAAIYVDGPPHDQPEQVREDDRITAGLMEMGYVVIRFHHGSDWNAVFRRHPDVFGTPRT
jgi:very-short-patch-repair endonuclease